MAFLPATPKQIPDHSILDYYYKQVYLGNQYIVSLAGTALTTSESNLLLLSNPGVQTGINPALFVRIKKSVCLTAANSALLRFYINPIVTGAGSAAVPINMRPAYGITNMVGVATTGPTTSSNGTLVDAIGDGALVSAESDNIIILDPGKKLLVTGLGSDAVTVDGFVSWYEL